MSRRRRRLTIASPAHRDQQHGVGHQTRSGARRLRRPSKGHAAKRPRTARNGSPRRLRGVERDHRVPLHLGLAETDGLAEIDEVVFVGRRLGAAAPLMPQVDPQRELEVVTGLLHRRLPALELQWLPGEWLDLRALGSKPLVLYCHPGVETGSFLGAADEQEPRVGAENEQERPVGADAAEARAFAEQSIELAAMSHRVVGVSSQSSARQLSLATSEALPHVVLSDDRLELAEEMGLPTFERDGMCLYERLTLIVREGRVEKVFYPVPDPVTHAAEVVEWLREGED